ncbi:MAG: class I SAM-dependent methyltransferase [Elusimicrobiota bacterium]
MKCIICDSDKNNIYCIAKSLDSFENIEYAYLRCNSCGLVFLMHRNNTDRTNIYEEGYYSREKPAFNKIIEQIMFYFGYWRWKKIEKYFGRSDGNKKLLDIGCGKGKFLHIARSNNWLVYGIEPSSRSYEVAVNKYHLNVLPREMCPDQFNAKEFDLITLWHVFEHLDNPETCLKTIHKWLKEKGCILIAVPNIGSIMSKFGKELWFNLDPPRHVFHYSQKSLEKILCKNNFAIINKSHFYPEIDFISVVLTLLNKIGIYPNFLFNFLKRNRKALPDNIFIFGLNLIITLSSLILIGIPIIFFTFIQALLGKGETMIIIAKKL